METFLWIAITILAIAVIKMANKKKPTFGKRQFINMVDQARRDFTDAATQKNVVKYVKMTTEICGVQFTALTELKTSIAKNNTAVAESEAAIADMRSEIRVRENQINTLTDRTKALVGYEALAS